MFFFLTLDIVLLKQNYLKLILPAVLTHFTMSVVVRGLLIAYILNISTCACYQGELINQKTFVLAICILLFQHNYSLQTYNLARSVPVYRKPLVIVTFIHLDGVSFYPVYRYQLSL